MPDCDAEGAEIAGEDGEPGDHHEPGAPGWAPGDGGGAYPAARPPLVGAMRGTVLKYEDPFLPAADPADWSAPR